MLPGHPLSAESLQHVYPGRYDGAGEVLTLRIRSRSLVTYARTTLIATRRPSYVPCDTSANPPHSTSTESSEQSGMCMDFGITRCRLHVLQSSLSNLSRSRSDMASFSRRYNLCQPGVGGEWKGTPYSFRQHVSELLIANLAKTGRKKQLVGGFFHVAADGWLVKMCGT